MNPDRRQLQRERPEGLSYIQFEHEGGGIVFNASEQGLAFHAAAAGRHPGPIRLCVSPTPLERIEVLAEIVWMDESKRFGGLRFAELTAEARNRIRRWLKPGESAAPAWEFAAPSCAPRKEAGPSSHAQNGTPEPLLPAPNMRKGMPPLADSKAVPAPQYCRIPATGLLPDPFSQEKQISASRPRLQRGLATGFLIVVFVFVSILLFENFRREIGSSLIGIGEKLKGDGATQTDAASIPVPFSSPAIESTPSLPHPIPETPANETLDQSVPAASTQKTEGAPDFKDTRVEVLQSSRKYLAGVDTQRGRSGVARQLWSAVEAGDSSAEVALAKLYRTGDGVPRSCEQARVLLRAASKSGNIEARQQLRSLNKNNCR
jgi:PilZ domain-containing protein